MHVQSPSRTKLLSTHKCCWNQWKLQGRCDFQTQLILLQKARHRLKALFWSWIKRFLYWWVSSVLFPEGRIRHAAPNRPSPRAGWEGKKKTSVPRWAEFRRITNPFAHTGSKSTVGKVILWGTHRFMLQINRPRRGSQWKNLSFI